MATFTQSLLVSTHKCVKAIYGLRDVRKAASATWCKIGNNKSFTVEIDVPGYDKFVWCDRAHDAYEARHKAWRAFMAKYPNQFSASRESAIIFD